MLVCRVLYVWLVDIRVSALAEMKVLRVLLGMSPALKGPPWSADHTMAKLARCT